MFGFLIAIVAGYLVPHLVAPVARPFAKHLRKFITIAETEMQAIAAMLATLGGAIIASIFDSGSAIGISVGVLTGYFLPRILAAVNRK